jgi:cytochrome c oxidase subunit I+III
MTVTATPPPGRGESPAEDLDGLYGTTAGFVGFLTAVSHKPIAVRFIATALFFFGVGGLLAIAIRLQLIEPDNDLIGADAFNQLFTMHGSVMMFLFAVPFLEGVANYLLPLMIGSRDMAMPRLNSFNYYTYLAGGVLLLSSVLFASVPDGGWFGYVPLTGPVFSPEKNIDFWLLGITLAEISAIGAAIEIIVTIMRNRAPGMTLARMPIFVWAMLVTAFMILFAFTALALGGVLLEADRAFGTAFYEPERGGDPVLWQHFFWIFGHPEVYVIFLPAAGMVSQIVQVMTGRRLVGYAFVVAATLATGFLSMGLWVHHMFTAGIPILALAFFSAASLAIAIPNGIQVFAWIATIWEGRPRFTTSMLFVIGFIVLFTLGGITGVMVAVVPFDWQAHDTYFVVAHLHYVLIGGAIFPALAAAYHWFPKLSGRMLSEGIGKLSFWLAFVGFNLTFFPMHVVGLLGMPRRVYTYPDEPGWQALNLLATVGAFLFAAGLITTLVNLVMSKRRGAAAPPDPWGGDTFEWAVDSPPPSYNFARPPVGSVRHPLWDTAPQDTGLEEPEPEGLELVTALDHRPVRWRATPGTSVVAARPLEIIHLPGPTLVPLVPVAGLVLVALGLLAETMAATVIGVVVLLLGVVGWAVRNEAERREAIASEPVPGGLPLDGETGPGIGRWGVGLGITVGLTAFGSLLFAYLYLEIHAEEWPPLRSAETSPPIGYAGLGLALTVAAAAFSRYAGRSGHTGWSSLSAGLVASSIAGLLGAMVWMVGWGALGFSYDLDGFTSSFYAVSATAALAVLMAAFASLVTVGVGQSVSRPERRMELTTRCRAFWYFAVVCMAAAFGVLHVLPIWTWG